MNRQSKTKSIEKGFTLVELAIVIVIIGIIAGLTITYHGGVKDKANNAKAKSDVAELAEFAYTSFVMTEGKYKNLGHLTQAYTGGTQANGEPEIWTSYRCGQGWMDLRNLPKSHDCWQDYYKSLDNIAAATGQDVEPFKAGDPWGSPYIIDENEGEGIPPLCMRRDMFSSAGKDGIWYDNVFHSAPANDDDIRLYLTRNKEEPDC